MLPIARACPKLPNISYPLIRGLWIGHAHRPHPKRYASIAFTHRAVNTAIYDYLSSWELLGHYVSENMWDPAVDPFSEMHEGCCVWQLIGRNQGYCCETCTMGLG